MKKFIILLISLFLGVILSNNTSIDKIEKNDITTLAVCTDSHVDILSTDPPPTVYTIMSTGYNLQSYLANSINNHSTKVNNVLPIISDYITYIGKNTLSFQSVTCIPTKTLGLLKTVVNKVDFNIYLYHVINKLGQT